MNTRGLTALFLRLGVCIVSVQSTELDGIYANACEDAAIASPDEYLELVAIPQDVDQVSMVTWTAYPGSYVAGEATETVWGDTWVTVAPEVQEKCCGVDSDQLNLRLQQLLGLPYEPEKERTFVEFDVNVSDIFRPCTSPDVHTHTCPEEFSHGGDMYFAEFFANQVTASYKVPGGYPWTRLGYTYDWNPCASSGEYGATEYVIRQGSVVQVTSVQSSEEYCAC